MRAVLLAAMLATPFAVMVTNAAHARPGVIGHVEDDRHQFVDFTANGDGTITLKVSNGSKFNPMWVVVHTDYFSESGESLGRRSYRVYCPAPSIGGGQERSFTFPDPNVGDFAGVLMHSNKMAPWERPSPGWIEPVGGYPTNPVPRVPRRHDVLTF